MPETLKNYSITEFMLCDLAINIASYVNLIKNVDFDVIDDHLPLVHIMKSKAEYSTKNNTILRD